MSRPRKSPAPFSAVESVIHTVRGERVILNADLAKLYGVPTKAFKQAAELTSMGLRSVEMPGTSTEGHETLIPNQIQS